MLEDSLRIEQNDEGQTTTNEVVEVVGVHKPIEFENIVDVVEDVGIKKNIEVENVATVEEDVDIEKHIEIVKDDASREPIAQDTKSVVFRVELTPIPMVESKSEKGKLWRVETSLDSLDAPKGEKMDELQEEEQKEELGGVVEGNLRIS